MTDGKSDEVCNLFAGQSPLVEEEEGSQFVLQSDISLLHPSLAACRLAFLCDLAVS